MEFIHVHRGSIRQLTSSAGFTLVELMVVLAIMVTITGIVFTSQSTFNKELMLANTAYDVALSLRSAETYGLGSRVAGSARNAGHGIHFVRGTNQFTLFADTYPSVGSSGLCHAAPGGDSTRPDAQPGDCVYNNSGESLKAYELGNGVTVSELYAGNSSVTSLDIVFARPNPDPFIRADGFTGTAYTSACIKLFSPQGGTHFVKVTSTGEITANASSCP